MALVGIELVTHVSEPDALTTRPPPCATTGFNQCTKPDNAIAPPSKCWKIYTNLTLGFEQCMKLNLKFG